MHQPHHELPRRAPVLMGIASVLTAYFFAIFLWGPTALGGHEGGAKSDHSQRDESHASHDRAPGDVINATPSPTAALHDAHLPDAGPDALDAEEASLHEKGAGSSTHAPIPAPYAVIPFVLLLAAIAILPLFEFSARWWESNRNRLLIAATLAAVTLAYYAVLFPGGGWDKVASVLEHAILVEYIPFIVLLFSLYTISGGIRIVGDLVAKPSTNVAFLAIGGLLASFVGTTGAAMLLIRALIDTNSERRYVQHTVVFFIFVVCNCGGCLLPIGDPPLFLGYLMGVDFLWTMKFLWWPWLLTNSMILAVYYVVDRSLYYPKETITDRKRDVHRERPIRITGLWPNLLLLLGVILSVGLLDASKVVPGTDWHPWPFLREAVQLGLVFLSLAWGKPAIRAENQFNYHAISEVAALFIGIFVCMQPAIEILHEQGSEFGLSSPHHFFWATGTLSAVLDNAPTYVVFFETAAAAFAGESFAQLVSQSSDQAIQAREILVGISLGAVFMGALTYIGNGPNFMVRAIAEQSGVKMPSFFGYIFRYSLLVLLPIFFIASYFTL